MNRSRTLVASILLLGALALAGCAQEGATPLTTARKPAPPPANMTPEQKKAYDEGMKNAGPLVGQSAGR